MKVKIIAIIGFLIAGIFVAISVIKGQATELVEYTNYLLLARDNAERNIPYVAAQNYRRAIAMDASDESVYREYMEQTRLLSEDHYMTAVKEYVKYFPESAQAYETLCQYYYDRELYKLVITTALEAREKEIATDTVRDLFLECSVMYKVIASGFSEAGSFVGNSAKVKTEDLYGYIQETGSYVILPKYEQASIFLSGYAAVLYENEWQMINEYGYKVALPDVPVEYLGILNNNRVLFALDGKYDYMTSALVVSEEIRFDEATNFKQGVAAVKKGDKWALINSDMQMITDYIFEDVLRDEYNTCCNNGVVFVKKDGKYFMCNAQGGRITDTAFDNAFPFVGTEPAAVCIDGKWGFVDNMGNIIVEPQYENAKSFNIGLGAVCKDGLWGYINTDNQIRIECQYVDCLPFSSNGITAICDEENTWTYIKLLSYIK